MQRHRARTDQALLTNPHERTPTMAQKIDPNKPSTWPDGYRQCGFCDFGSRDEKKVKAHLKTVHGKTVK